MGVGEKARLCLPGRGANELLLLLGSWPVSAGGDSIQGMDGSRNREEKGCTGLLCPPRLQGEVLGVKAACQRDGTGPQDCARHLGHLQLTLHPAYM